jgi:hypothetical protein
VRTQLLRRAAGTVFCDDVRVTATFDYDNTSGRPTGPLMTVLQLLLPGVRSVRRQIDPFAEQWARANRAALAADGPLWVALGDSMTQGIGASSFDRGWVGQLADRLRVQGRPHRVSTSRSPALGSRTPSSGSCPPSRR